eukprot:jgi/Chrpa1/10387/Chrysochromulina_OHIO_Genome00018835-RA
MPLAQPATPPAAQCMKRLDDSSSDEEARSPADRLSPACRVLASIDVNSPVRTAACAPAPLPTSVPRAHSPMAKRQLAADDAAAALEAQMARTQAARAHSLLPFVVDDFGGGTVDDPGGGTQAATAAAMIFQPPPAKTKRMRATRDATADDEEVEGARVPAAATSGRAPAAAEDDSLKPRSLYECIELASEGSEHASAILNISLDGWIEVYTSDKRAGIVEWFDMAVQAAGTELTKAFKHGLWKLMETLLDKVKHEILFDEVLMPRLLEWFEICRQEYNQGMQHITVEFAMAAFERLAHIAEELGSARQNAERFCSGKRRKDAMGQSLSLSANAEQLAAHEEAVRDMLSTIFDQVISYRYRDTHEDIRAACISALGRGLRVLPSFCDDKHLKYMGWQLSDLQSAAVRLASLQALAHVYKAFDEIKDLTPVRHFTERFESRLLLMIKDVDDDVAVEAIRLELGLLKSFAWTKRAALHLMFQRDVQPKLWTALGPLIQLHL